MLVQKNELSLEFSFKLDRAAESLAAANAAIQTEKDIQNDITGVLASCMANLMKTCKSKSRRPLYVPNECCIRNINPTLVVIWNSSLKPAAKGISSVFC